MSWSKSVYSSNVSEIGYDETTQELTVRWKNGRVSAYKGVSEEKALEVANAASVGGILNDEIKPNFSHRYV